MKRLLDSRPVYEAACWVAALYIRLVWATGRWTVENREVIDRMVRDGQPFVACLWHGRMLMMPYSWPYDAPMDVLISQHRDGRFIAGTLKHFGFGTIAGSTSRGGGEALRRLLATLAGGGHVCVTPDGPRGPRMRVSAGVVRAARLAGVPIVPLSYTASRRRVMRSWDRFVLTLPFARGIIRFGDPMPPPENGGADAIEAARRSLEDRLNTMTRELDAAFDLAPIEAAEEGAAGDRAARRGAAFQAAGCGR